MRGWMLVFLMMAVTAALAAASGAISIGPALLTSTVFALLLILSALARMMRGRA